MHRQRNIHFISTEVRISRNSQDLRMVNTFSLVARSVLSVSRCQPYCNRRRKRWLLCEHISSVHITFCTFDKSRTSAILSASRSGEVDHSSILDSESTVG